MSNWTRERLEALAVGWLEEVKAKDREEESMDNCGDAVVLMNFTAPADAQWEFVQIAVSAATDETEFFAIAAGPFEHLMGFHGEAYIDRVEHLATTNPDFQKMVCGAWRHKMSNKVWARVEAMQASAEGKG